MKNLINASEIEKEMLYDLYWNKGMSRRQIAKKLGVSKTVIENRMEKYNIPTRSREEGFRLRMSRDQKHLLASKATLQELYWDKKMSTVEIGKKLGVSPYTVWQWLKKYNIPTRSMDEGLRLSLQKRQATIDPPQDIEKEKQILYLQGLRDGKKIILNELKQFIEKHNIGGEK